MMMIGRMEQLAGFISELFFQGPALANFFESPRRPQRDA